MNFVSYLNYLKSKKPIKVKNNENIIVMSFNIRCVSNEDKGIRYYKFRAPFIRKVLEEENPDVIGFQEVKVKQYKYLLKILKEYDYVYKKRDDRREGEANPIFYKRNRFTCIKHDTFWLSDTYKVMSNTFNGRCFRICTYACLKDNKTNKEFYVFNTHLDHRNDIARVKGVKLIKRVINELDIKLPYLIMGDMNDFYNSLPINELFSTYIDASKFNHKENEPTFHDYGRDKQKIDYIALTEDIKQLDYKVVTTKFNDDIYPSDHYPIEVVINV